MEETSTISIDLVVPKGVVDSMLNRDYRAEEDWNNQLPKSGDSKAGKLTLQIPNQSLDSPEEWFYESRLLQVLIFYIRQFLSI